MIGKWFLLKTIIAIVLVFIVGLIVEHAVWEIRLRTGPHAYFVVSSSFGYVSGVRGGSAYQNDSTVAGPFKTLARCKLELSNWKNFPGLNYYCRDLLISDAKAIWGK
jgi:hypothetical protein